MKTGITIFCFLLLFTSCKKFLDVIPESDIAKDELFNTAEGFEEALNGVYSRATQGDIYGNELTFGLPDVLAQNYSISFFDNMAYRQTALFNYTDAGFTGRRDAIWKGLYHAISSCNLILENIEEKKNLLSSENYALIKAEALALRAYFHFDLLRLFAPSFITEPTGRGIPYVTAFTNKVTPMSTVSEALEKVIADLEAAKALLLPVDPIISSDYVVGYPGDDDALEQDSPSLFLHNRRHRMNYYAVCGSLARAYLYKQDHPKALTHAQIVIDAEKFPWTKTVDFITPDLTQKDRILYKELVFAWYIPNRQQDLLNRFAAGGAGLYIEENAGKALFEVAGVGAEDLRFKEWMRLAIDISASRYEVQKYLRDDQENRHPVVAPALRISELYYIAAEASYDTDPQQALDYFNTVRFHRGIGTTLNVGSRDAFIRELINEARKEFYAEGQIFYMYKRLNKNITGPGGTSFPVTNTIFVLPLPNDEIEFGNR